jgi:alpha-D-glucose phosphate-specific phosphoglucomutase
MTDIKFGTDGWRGVINKDFTLDNVRVVAQAIADYINSVSLPKKELGVGYDARSLSEQSAGAISEVLAANGIKVLLGKGIVSTPTLVYAIKHHSLGGGVMVTASHNPPRFNGIKFKPYYAGSADDGITKGIEAFLWKERPKTVPLEQAKHKGMVRVGDLWAAYEDELKSYVDLRLLEESSFKVIVDPMHGCQGRLLERVLSGTSCEVKTIHADPDPAFGGLLPEPIPPHIEELQKTVLAEGADVGLAADADGDRVGAVDSKGQFVTPHQIIAMLLLHFFNNRGEKGIVVKTVTTSTLIEKIADNLNLPLRETPVGFKHICKIMREEDVLIGGEESGGISYKGYFPERDGALSALLLLELMATEGTRLEEIMAQIDAKYGSFRYRRKDITYPNEKKPKLFDTLKNNPPEYLNDKKVVQVKTFDGVKMILEGDDWLMLRASGTEPILRIYAEAKSFDDVDRLLETGNSIAQQIE